jgi:chitinase
MLGGAAKGSFRKLDGDRASFLDFYAPVRDMVRTLNLDGLDLDVEEDMSLAGIIRLIDHLKEDFGKEFLITLAPVATALQGLRHLSGFDYEALEKAMGRHVAWYNTQFYCGWGDVSTTAGYDAIMRRGWPADKIVLGVISNPEGGAGWVPDDLLEGTIRALRARYPSFGGVMSWEYFNSITVAEPYGWPWCWANLMTRILHPDIARPAAIIGNPQATEASIVQG